jgi:D-alanyl-lipoteichoic acid acyltransferase DltB (MBOAT superfamily)
LLAFAGQIYGDFAGYTDMAIGLALLLGFKIPINFRLPYFALSPVDFWRRWHISLSTWLRDYLYISLGGNRTGNRTRNVMITMLLGGLWHGAAWTFVVWGAFHGVLIGWVLFRATTIGRAGELLAQMHGFGFHAEPAGNAVTILAWCVGMPLFMHLVDLFVLQRGPWLVKKARLLWLLVVIFQSLCLMTGEPSDEFIYFQF